jgi:hypothetical protein
MLMNPGHGNKMSTRTERVITCLLSGKTLEEAAKECRLCVSTIKKWRQQPEFQSAYRRARAEFFERSLDQLLSVRSEAVATLRRNLTCGEFGAENRAAAILLERGEKDQETVEILARLAALESRLVSPGTPTANGALRS